MEKIAFLDRDGCLIFEPPNTKQIDSLAKLQVLPKVIEGLQNLQREGYELVLVSNQNGVGSKSFPKRAFEIPQKKFLEILKKEGITFSQVFICPHLPSTNCACRKPKIGLLKNFLKQEKIDFTQSFMLGDRDTDSEFGKNLGVASFQMQTNGDFPRLGFVKRKTTETDIFVGCNLDGKGIYKIETGIGFFDHMLEQFSRHALVDLTISAKGDLQVDKHHTVEDVAITLGEALSKALGNRAGIRRFSTLIPMDDALAETALDLSGRPFLVFNAKFKSEMVGEFPTELLEHFFQSLTQSLKANLHINVKAGKNEHHKIEAIFKSFAKSFRFAIEKDVRLDNLIPSTKGSL